MARDCRFTVVFDRSEERALVVLAQQLRRSRSDVVRVLIAEEAVRRNILPPGMQTAPTMRTCQSRQGISEVVSAKGQDTGVLTERGFS